MVSLLHVYDGFFFLLLLISCLIIVAGVSGSKCPPLLPCGDIGNLSFPFTTTSHPNCGMLVIHGCDDEPGSKKSIQNNNRWFEVVSFRLDFFHQSTITIRDDRLLALLQSRRCEVLEYNSTFAVNSPLVSSRLSYYVYLLRCNHPVDPVPPTILSDSTVCRNNTFYQANEPSVALGDVGPMLNSSHGCSIIKLPLGGRVISKDFNDLFNYSLAADIPIEIAVSQDCSSCHYVYGGQCRIDSYGKFYCDQGETSRKMVHIAVASITGVLGVLIVLAWCFRRHFYHKVDPSCHKIEIFLKDHGHLEAKRYSYLEVKKATNCFKDKLGQGGYGSVYKGKLPDGTLVAVKVLSESKGNDDDFINEVASISVTSHVNIVQLLGFCLENSKRALIYKYMPNGSVDKFIYEDKDPLKFNPQLSCKTMYNIAIGVAQGLDYMHKGCNSKIVHFDIKPHNVLLDENFCPKISDFGLAKICTKEESIVSLLGARGTIGYIAPEVFSRNFGEVSHKSDVYSYGMMILEMIGERKNVNIENEANVKYSSSEIYFPHWIYKCLELNQEPRLRCIRNELDKELIQKMIIVSLWCIQADPSNRPTMSKVVDMMESALEFLEIPPKPYLFSPSRSPMRLSDSSHSNL